MPDPYSGSVPHKETPAILLYSEQVIWFRSNEGELRKLLINLYKVIIQKTGQKAKNFQ